MKALTLFLLLFYGTVSATEGGSQKNINIADPTIFFENGVYYLYGTETLPEYGFPVYTSNNLQTWDKSSLHNNYVLKKDRAVYGEQGFWAPQVVRHNNKYYMLYTANEQIAIAQSKSPLGPFTQKKVSPIDLKSKQIDPYLFIDDDSKMYLYHVRLGGGNKIYVAEFKKDFSGIIQETLTHCVSAEENWEDTKRIPAPPIAEGPTVIKHKGTYYMFYSANDFRNIDYAVGYATSSSPLGPWKKYANNPIIDRNKTGLNGSGHGDLFTDKQGNLKYVFHAHNDNNNVLPRRTFMVSLKFVPDSKSGIDKVIIDSQSISDVVSK